MVLLGALVASEIALRAADSTVGPIGFLRNGFYALELNATVPSFYREHFCDPMHFTTSGEALAARCLAEMDPELFRRHKRVWLLGGSTTAGGSCDAPKSSNWGARLAQRFPNLEIVNLAQADSNSDYTLSVLSEPSDRPTADLIIAADGMNEFRAHMDERDPNHQEIRRLLNVTRVSPLQTRLLTGHVWILRSMRTAYERSLVFRAACNAARVALNRIAILAQATAAYQLGGDPAQSDDRTGERLARQPFYPMLERKSSAYGLANYAINMRKLQEFAKQRGIELVMLSLPTAPDAFLPDNPKANAALYDWARLYLAENQRISRSLRIKLLDIRPCFEEAASRAARAGAKR